MLDVYEMFVSRTGRITGKQSSFYCFYARHHDYTQYLVEVVIVA